MRKALIFIAIVVVGALLGSFLGRLLGAVLPAGAIHDAFVREMTVGLAPAHLDLRVLDLTFGFHLHFNLMSVIGLLLALSLFRVLFK